MLGYNFKVRGDTVVREIFLGLFGNDAVKKRFSTAILSGTLPHAFLIDGPSGSGKRTLVLEISAALNCENRTDGTKPLPCRRCNTCRRIFEGSYTDIKSLSLQKGKSTVGVDAVKDFKEDMFLTATESDYKIYVFENAEALTPQAQNALLTVMEEPPPNVIIFLLSSSSDKILTTIKSRAQYVSMERFDRNRLEDFLISAVPPAAILKGTDPDSFSAVISKSGGYIGRAKKLLDPEGAARAKEEREAVGKFTAALDTRAPFSELYSAISGFPSLRGELILMLEEVDAAISDMIKFKNSEDTEHFTFYYSREDVGQAAKGISLPRLFKAHELIVTASEQLSKNAMTDTVLSSLAANLKLI